MTVLHQYTYTGDTIDILVKLFILAAWLLFLLWMWFDSAEKTWEKAVITAIMGFVFMFVVMLFIKVSKSTTTRYKIKMEEKVDLNEFLMQYKIVGTEGDIIVIEQIEQGE